MEVAAALFTMAGTAGTAAAGTAATSAAAWAAGTTVTTAAGVTTSLAGASAALGTLQGVYTGFQMLGQVVSGVGSVYGALSAAGGAKAAAEQDALASEDRALRIRRELLQKAGAARVAFAASGVDISSGSAAAVDDSLRDEADYETGIEQRNAAMTRAAGRARARAYRIRGATSLLATAAQVGGTYANYATDVARRG